MNQDKMLMREMRIVLNLIFIMMSWLLNYSRGLQGIIHLFFERDSYLCLSLLFLCAFLHFYYLPNNFTRMHLQSNKNKLFNNFDRYSTPLRKENKRLLDKFILSRSWSLHRSSYSYILEKNASRDYGFYRCNISFMTAERHKFTKR